MDTNYKLMDQLINNQNKTKHKLSASHFDKDTK